MIDGLTTTAAAAVWLLEGAAAGPGAIFQHVLPRSRMTNLFLYLSTVPYAYEVRALADSQAIGDGPRGRTRLRR